MNFTISPIEAAIITGVMQIVAPLLKKIINQSWRAVAIFGIAILTELVMRAIHGSMDLNMVITMLGVGFANMAVFKMVKDTLSVNP